MEFDNSYLETIYRAGIAGRDIHQNYIGTSETEFKDDGSPVTVADKSAAEKIHSIISENHQNPVIVEEELSPENVAITGDTWYVDPLDGTIPYTMQMPMYTVSIAVADSSGLKAGGILASATNEFMYALRDDGTYYVPDVDDSNPREVSVSDTTEPENGKYYVSGLGDKDDKPDKWESVYGKISKGDIIWSRAAAYSVSRVAIGSLDGILNYNLGPWDIAAGALLVKEAGGEVITKDGSSWEQLRKGKTIIATNGKLGLSLDNHV